ncbi:MAG: hypothetical protein Q9196_005051 [Gyalolechia fulgens]
MMSRTALRASKASAKPASSALARRTFHSTPARFDSPYHYPEDTGEQWVRGLAELLSEV